MWQALTEDFQPWDVLADVTGYEDDQLGRLIVSPGWVAAVGPGRIARRRVDLDAAARVVGVAGVLADRAGRYADERLAWAWWLEELAWMRAPAPAKRCRHDPAPGQTVLVLLDLSPWQRYGPHPRHLRWPRSPTPGRPRRPGPGRANFAAPLARIRRDRLDPPGYLPAPAA